MEGLVQIVVDAPRERGGVIRQLCVKRLPYRISRPIHSVDNCNPTRIPNLRTCEDMVSHIAGLSRVGGVIPFVTGCKYVSCFGRGNTLYSAEAFASNHPSNQKSVRCDSVDAWLHRVSFLQDLILVDPLCCLYPSAPTQLLCLRRKAVHYAAVGASSQDAGLSPTVP